MVRVSSTPSDGGGIMRRIALFVALLVVLPRAAGAQIAYEGCRDAYGLPVATVLDPSLRGDVAQATLAPNGAPVIRYNPNSVLPIATPAVMTFFVLHECAHHATGQVRALTAGQIAYTMQVELQADCWAAVNL